ncbi:hypothetical protein ABZ942_43495 [Nocardia sp. NPDC046473]|uniref:phthiocerol/phthiodiolone dimycocerosyl transferase family protein n=1 Tax=Nocardia sp. NPDC046473 TaxID=3155733 RepID=UPI0033FA9B65
MTTAEILRALAPTEKPYAHNEVYEGYTVRTSGRLDLKALDTAYKAVCGAYPVLAARLETGDSGPVLVASGTLPDVRVCDGEPEYPLTGAELNQHRALSALNVVRDGTDASVTLATHHSVADGAYSLEVLAALWSCYTDAVHGMAVDLPRHPYPKSLEELLAERGIHRAVPAEAETAQPPATTTQPASELFEIVPYVAQYRLTAAQTTALTELGHREHVTINELLSGAVLLVEAEVRDLPLTDLLYLFAVNLRSHLAPRVGDTEGTNVVGSSWFMATGGIEPDAVTIGRAVGAQLRAGLADGSVQRSLMDMADQHAAGAVPHDLGPVVISMTNWGLIPPLRSPDDLVLTNFHSASRGKIAPGQAALVCSYVASTFDGRIGIDLGWPEKNSEQSRRLECLHEHLSRLASQS